VFDRGFEFGELFSQIVIGRALVDETRRAGQEDAAALGGGLTIRSRLSAVLDLATVS
jgi:hypothetical protein